MLAYLIILSIAVAGMMHTHWWAAVAGGCVLALLALAERRTATVPWIMKSEPIALPAYAFINGSLAATVAFALGRASGWIWGI